MTGQRTLLLLAVLCIPGTGAACAHSQADTPVLLRSRTPDERLRRERVVPRVLSTAEADRLLPVGAGPRRPVNASGLVVLYFVMGAQGLDDQLVSTDVAREIALDDHELHQLALANWYRMEPVGKFKKIVKIAESGVLTASRTRRFNDAATSLLAISSLLTRADRLSALLIDSDTVALAVPDVNWAEARKRIEGLPPRKQPHRGDVTAPVFSEPVTICRASMNCGLR